SGRTLDTGMTDHDLLLLGKLSLTADHGWVLPAGTETHRLQIDHGFGRTR
ncbi:hypothetical protein A2U01_0096413, partial [Trifolium medium]|nr:hypothetical protein [Trifolium medium]